jgi:hypothetical protein
VIQSADGRSWTFTNPTTGDRLQYRLKYGDLLYLYVDHGHGGQWFMSSTPPTTVTGTVQQAVTARIQQWHHGPVWITHD